MPRVTFGRVMVAIIGALIVVVIVVASSRAKPAELHLTRADLGTRWPLTVSDVTLHCEVSGEYKFLTFDADGKTYALNGSARQYADDEGWLDLAEVWTTDGTGGHVDPSDLVSRGLALCPSNS